MPSACLSANSIVWKFNLKFFSFKTSFDGEPLKCKCSLCKLQSVLAWRWKKTVCLMLSKNSLRVCLTNHLCAHHMRQDVNFWRSSADASVVFFSVESSQPWYSWLWSEKANTTDPIELVYLLLRMAWRALYKSNTDKRRRLPVKNEMSVCISHKSFMIIPSIMNISFDPACTEV